MKFFLSLVLVALNFSCLATELVVIGEGKASIEPDQAKVSFEVAYESREMSVAQKEVAKKVSQVKTSLAKKFKVNEKEIKTGSFSGQKQFEYPRDGKRKFKGYIVSHSLEFMMSDLKSLGKLLDHLSSLKVSEVHNPQFSSSKEEELKQSALKDAVSNAQLKAKALSQSIKKKITKIDSITENTFSYHQPFMQVSSMEMMKSSPSTEINSDKVSAEAKVTVKYILD